MQSNTAVLFITWTVYGTFLSGDARGWRHRNEGQMTSRPLLSRWHGERLKYPVLTLNSEMRCVAEKGIIEICKIREWSLKALSLRSNHVHVVVEVANYKPELVRDQLKAKSTLDLRRAFDAWLDRPVWTAKGHIEFLHHKRQIELCVRYVEEAQDRRHMEP